MESALIYKPFNQIELNAVSVHYFASSTNTERLHVAAETAIIAAMIVGIITNKPQQLSCVHGDTTVIVIDNCAVDNGVVSATLKLEANCEFVAIHQLEYYL